MKEMFNGATSFNQDLSKWDVSQVTYMTKMFHRAHSFNQDLSKWDVSHVKGMVSMFEGAASFYQTLCGVAWVSSKAPQDDMFKDSPGSICSPSTISVTNKISTDPEPSSSLRTSNTTITPIVIDGPAAPSHLFSIIVGTAFATLVVIVTVVIVLVVIRLKRSTVSHASSQSETDSITLVARTPNTVP
jgi:surface protein